MPSTFDINDDEEDSGSVQSADAVFRKQGGASNEICSDNNSEEEIEPESVPVHEGSRTNFLLMRPPAILYLWYMLEHCDMLALCPDQFPASVAATSDNVTDVSSPTDSSRSPSSTNEKKCKVEAVLDKNQKQVMDAMQGHVRSIREDGRLNRMQMEVSSLRNTLLRSEDQLSEAAKNLRESKKAFHCSCCSSDEDEDDKEDAKKDVEEDEEKVQSLKSRIKDLGSKICQIEEHINLREPSTIDSTPQTNNWSYRIRWKI
jgi:hypothetical protein